MRSPTRRDIQFVYFDLDDTLLDHRYAERMAIGDVCGTFAEQFGHLSLEHVQDTYHRHHATLWQRYGAGEISKAELQRLRFEYLLDALHIQDGDPGALNACYEEYYTRHWILSEPARETFLIIADHFPVGILTNGFAEVQEAKLARFPEIRARLSAKVVSEHVGYLKPHPALFAHAAQVVATKPESILYIGDSFHSDVEGALRAGWQAAWFTAEHAEPESDEAFFRFSKWSDLMCWLGV